MIAAPAVEGEGVPGPARLDRGGMRRDVGDDVAAEQVGTAMLVVAAGVSKHNT